MDGWRGHLRALELQPCVRVAGANHDGVLHSFSSNGGVTASMPVYRRVTAVYKHHGLAVRFAFFECERARSRFVAEICIL